MPRRIHNISLATRLSLVALAVTLVSLAVTAAVGLTRGSDLADDVIDDRLVVLSSSRADTIELYLRSVRRQVEATAASPSTAETIGELAGAVFELAAGDPDPSVVEPVTEFYLADVVPELERVGGEGSTNASALVPDGAAALSLQLAYTVPRETDGGVEIAPELVVDAGDGSAYSALHREVEATFGGLVLGSGFDDVYLIEAETDTVVYSYRKRIDFGTSLALGPHSGSGLGRLLDTIGVSESSGARMSGFVPYVPAFERPTMFVAAPVVVDDSVVGYLAVALSHEVFDDLLAGEPRWDAFGVSGDAYVVNLDATMVTTARAYEEAPADFRAAATEAGPGQLPTADLRRITATGTTALVQGVPTDLVVTAGADPQIVEGPNFAGEAVRTSYRRLDLDDVTWTIVVEVQTEELDETIEDYARDMLIAIALFVVGVTFVAVRWSNRLVAPVRAISVRLRRARAVAAAVDDPADVPPLVEAEIAARQVESDAEGADEPDRDPGPVEFVELGSNVDEMLVRLRDRRAAVAERARERRALLQQFVPASVAQRSEELDSEVLDHVRQATVAVIEVAGVGELVADRPEQEVRDLIAEIVDEVDALAADAGVERVKLIGSMYYAVCGANRPLLDHPPRTVAFALRVRDAIGDITDGAVAVRIGVAEGAVSVGLAERSALVYDIWGPTVAEAEQLARSGTDGAVMVSATVRSHLPDEYVIVGEADGVAAVTGRVTEVSS